MKHIKGYYKKDTVSLAVAGKMLSLHKSTVKALINTGHLVMEMEQLSDGKLMTVISKASIKEYENLIKQARIREQTRISCQK